MDYVLEFEEVIDIIPCALYVIKDSQIIKCNNATLNIFGYSSEEEFIGLELFDLSPELQEDGNLSIEKGKEYLAEALKEDNKHISFQWLHKRKDGTTFLANIKIYNKKGLLYILILDINENNKLEHEKLMLDTLFFNSPYAVAMIDENRRITNINNNFTNLFQYGLEEIKGHEIEYLVSPVDSLEVIENNLQQIFQGEVVKQEGLRKQKDGKLIDVEILGYPIINNQTIIGGCIIYIDITYKKTYERQLHLFRKVLENNTEGVFIANVVGEIEWINNAFKEITGYSLEDVKEKNKNILNSEKDEGAFYQDILDNLEYKGTWSGEILHKNKNGKYCVEWLTINSISFDSDKTTHYVGVFKDLSEKKMIDRRISDLQQKDSLTRLFNKNYFLELVDRYIIDSQKNNDEFAIVFIDLDRFKDINDSIGHIVGDKLLVEFSNRLLTIMNQNYILSRFNGDEFAILCKDLNNNDLNNFLKELTNLIKIPFKIGNNILHLSVNIGVSRYPDNALDAESLVRYADIAMSKAKGLTEDRICFYTNEMAKDIEMKFHLNNYLVSAISNNELTIHYQPIFDIKRNNTIKGAEALLRWTNPTLGMIPPNKFIPLAEKTGQIIAIGEWVLVNVCRQINQWKSKGYNISPIAVNISVKQLEQAGFAQTVINILKRNKVESNNIELEITESISTGDTTTIIKNLKDLKDNGINISMDDFGTGFSSLGQLDLLELDKLKIDKIFIDDLVNVTKRQNLVKSIIAMAGSLDLTVVAEGIETIEQLSYLRELGCQLGQGYLFSKPIPAKEIEYLIDSL